jgi:hypothetical protein
VHSRIIFILGEMGTWIPQLPGGSEVEKKRRDGDGKVGDGHDVCSSTIGLKLSVGHVHRWWIMRRRPGKGLERRGWG